VRKWLSYLKNKFVLASVIFVVYALFLDENDIFTLLNERKKYNELNEATQATNKKLQETLNTIDKLKYQSEVERFAREEKLFKKDDEDVFVIFYE
jgi:hypothetical protein